MTTAARRRLMRDFKRLQVHYISEVNFSFYWPQLDTAKCPKSLAQCCTVSCHIKMDGIWYSLKRIETASFKSYILDDFAAICLRNSDPFYLVIYYIKWVTTSWTYSNIGSLVSSV